MKTTFFLLIAALGAFLSSALGQIQNFPTVKDFGAVGDGVTDDLPSFQAAITASLQQGPSVYPTRGIVVVPPGTYFLNGTLVLENSVRLIGHGAGQPGGNWASTLKFPANTKGIQIVKAITSPPENGADASVIEGLLLNGGGGTDPSAHGIDMEAAIKVRDCTIQRFSGNGIQIVANTAAGTNASNWSLDTLRIGNCTGHGLYVSGTAAGGGIASAVNTVANGGWGILDESEHGNTYTGAHTATNTLGSYRADHPDARNIFVGCYSEGGQPASIIDYPGIVVGGLHGAGLQGTGYFLMANNPILAAANTNQSATIEFADGPSGEMLTLADIDHPASPFRLKHYFGRFYLDWGDVANSEILQLFNPLATPANGYARDLSERRGGLGLPKGYYAHSTMKYRGEGSAPPGSGSWVRGDIIYNLAPVAGGYLGWQCVASGTPGTWKGFGAIEP